MLISKSESMEITALGENFPRMCRLFYLPLTLLNTPFGIGLIHGRLYSANMNPLNLSEACLGKGPYLEMLASQLVSFESQQQRFISFHPYHHPNTSSERKRPIYSGSWPLYCLTSSTVSSSRSLPYLSPQMRTQSSLLHFSRSTSSLYEGGTEL